MDNIHEQTVITSYLDSVSDTILLKEIHARMISRLKHHYSC